MSIRTTSMAALLSGLILAAAPASSFADQTSTIFPPTNCDKNEMRAITWRDGSTGTVCASTQELLRSGLPNCQDGEHVVYHDATCTTGRAPVGLSESSQGMFVCEPVPTAIYFKITTAHQDAKFGTPTTAGLKNVLYDKGSGYSANREVYIAPADGLYALSVVAGWYDIGAGKFSQAGIESDAGAVCYQSAPGTAGHVYNSCSGQTYLKKGQSVWAVIYHADDASDWASVELMGAKLAD